MTRRRAGYPPRRGCAGLVSSRRWAILADLAMRGLAISFLTATRVALEMSFDPEGFVENVGDALGFPERQVTNDLKHFKEFIEHRGQETGAWRG